MKYTAALSVAIAPLAIAKAVHNNYPHKRNGHLQELGAVEGMAGLEGLGGGAAAVAAGGSTNVIVIWANAGGAAATETIHEQVTVTQTVTEGAAAATSVIPPAAAVTHEVMVGGAAGLVFTPPEVAAAVGDMVVFTFMSMNHTATQSTFDLPCDAMEGGMDSGFMPNPDNTIEPAPQVAMQVMVDTPLWFYCKQMGHCGKGMTFSINPSAEKTQAMFQAAAIAQKGAGAGSAITGNATASAGADAAASSVVAPPAATASAAPPSVTEGSGMVEGGACICAVACGAGSFPAVNAQGIGAFGGIAGGIPSSMMEGA